MDDEGWLRGTLLKSGQSGLLPSNYIEIIDGTLDTDSVLLFSHTRFVFLVADHDLYSKFSVADWSLGNHIVRRRRKLFHAFLVLFVV